jgi:hypothetical protein
LPDRAADGVRQHVEPLGRDAGQIEEGLVDRVGFDSRGELRERLHDALAHGPWSA